MVFWQDYRINTEILFCYSLCLLRKLFLNKFNLFRRLNIWHYTSTKYLENVIIFEITYFLFISFLAKRNEPKKGRPGVIVLRSHGTISREFQTHTHPPPYEIPFRKMPCSTGDSSGGNALTKCPARRQLRTPGNATRRNASFGVSVSRCVRQGKVFCRA